MNQQMVRAFTRGETGETRARDVVADLLIGFAAPAAPALRVGADVELASALLDLLGRPQGRLRAVPVAGSAGKGSVTAFVASMLDAPGFSVGAHWTAAGGTVSAAREGSGWN